MNINKYFCYQGHHSEGNQYQLPLRKDYLILNNKDISYKNVLPDIYKTHEKHESIRTRK